MQLARWWGGKGGDAIEVACDWESKGFGFAEERQLGH